MVGAARGKPCPKELSAALDKPLGVGGEASECESNGKVTRPPAAGRP